MVNASDLAKSKTPANLFKQKKHELVSYIWGIKESKIKSPIEKNAFIKAQAITLPRCLQTKVKMPFPHALPFPLNH
jgi:hypothetical protein